MNKIPGKHKPITEEMIEDLQSMGDQEFMSKWNVSRQYPIRARKRLGLKSFNNQHGTYPHEFKDGKEYKWCGCGHWEDVNNFGKHTSRYDGLRGNCKYHTNKFRTESYDRNDGAKTMREWLKTEKGKKSRSETMRRMWMKRRSYYVKFETDDEERIYALCNKSCAYCKTPAELSELEFDHFIPINSGGKTEVSNMLPACKNCNRGRGGKFDKDPYQWLVERFGQKYGSEIYVDCANLLECLK
jgi:5-methylcytosine-specific restriction endonuclease McrA